LKFHPDKGGDDSAYATISCLASTAGLVGSGKMPGRNILQQVSKASYAKSPPAKIGTLTLLTHTPTLKFYKAPDNTIVVGVRGTNDARDVKADAMIATNRLEQSDRYKEDVATMNRFQNSYPKDKFDYYGVGHSLGGAILDSLIHHRYLKNGVSYNPAVQMRDLLNKKSRNQRHYTKTDALGKIFTPLLHTAPTVREARPKNWWEKAIDYIPIANKAYETYAGHALDNFEGGAKNTDYATMKAEGAKAIFADMKKEGYVPAKYTRTGLGLLKKMFETDGMSHLPTEFRRYFIKYQNGESLKGYKYQGRGKNTNIAEQWIEALEEEEKEAIFVKDHPAGGMGRAAPTAAEINAYIESPLFHAKVKDIVVNVRNGFSEEEYAAPELGALTPEVIRDAEEDAGEDSDEEEEDEEEAAERERQEREEAEERARLERIRREQMEAYREYLEAEEERKRKLREESDERQVRKRAFIDEVNRESGYSGLKRR
jgi:hypothetical protein